MPGLTSLFNTLFTLYTLLIIARSFLPLTGISPYHPVSQWLYRLTEPLLAPIRNMLPPAGMQDWSPLVAIIVLFILQWIVTALLSSF
jgi:YggT family protein